MAEVFQSKYTASEVENLLDCMNENGEKIIENTENIEKNSKQILANEEKLKEIKQYQKYVNTELDSCFCKLSNNYTPVVGKYVPFVKESGSFEVNNGRVIVKSGQRVQIDIVLAYRNPNNNTYASMGFYIKDYTNDININYIAPLNGTPQYEYGHSQSCQYTNNTDKNCEIGLYVDSVTASDILNYENTSMTVQEIGRQIVIDPLEYVNETQGIEDVPIGHIIAYMGTIIPKHYLECDGKVYNISDYQELANHIKDNYGSFNAFGGDGETTFAVPDLRGEFLRGTGTAVRDSGSGANVGEHQEPTQHLIVQSSNQGMQAMVPLNSNNAQMYSESDKKYGASEYGSVTTNKANVLTIWKGHATHYSSRPTNTSVLYCIKY